MCIYIYIYTHVYIYIYIYIHMCIYINIYIYRERERDLQRASRSAPRAPPEPLRSISDHIILYYAMLYYIILS